jgi:hypothetical protein
MKTKRPSLHDFTGVFCLLVFNQLRVKLICGHLRWCVGTRGVMDLVHSGHSTTLTNTLFIPRPSWTTPKIVFVNTFI